jgi:hypothetical protein
MKQITKAPLGLCLSPISPVNVLGDPSHTKGNFIVVALRIILSFVAFEFNI